MADPRWMELGDLTEQVAQARLAVAAHAASNVAGCSDVSALTRTHDLLARELVELAPDIDGPAHTAFEAARRVSDVLRFEVPASHRRTGGALVTSAKRAVVSALKPFNSEVLRPQRRFNIEAIKVLELLWSRRAARIRDDSEIVVRKQLQPLISPTRWELRGHREGGPARLIKAAKAAYLHVAAPLLRPLLARQQAWNEEVVDALAAIAAPVAPDGFKAAALVTRLAALASEATPSAASRTLRASAGLWAEVFRRQERFNQEFTLAIAELLGTRLPPSGAPQFDYSAWIKSSEKLPEPGRASPRVVEVRLGRETTRPIQSVRDAAFVLLVGPDVELRRGAAAVWTGAAAGADLVYADEDRISGGQRASPFFKPDWSPELLETFNYFGRCILLRRELFNELREELHGPADAAMHRLSLAAVARGARVAHVPHVLFHRTDRAELDVGDEAGRVVLQEALSRTGEQVRVEIAPYGYRVRPVSEPRSLVSIIVPFRDRPDLLERLCDSLLSRTRYRDFELLLVSNQSVDPRTFEVLDRQQDPRVRKLRWDHPFNYSSINNFAAREAKGELLLFLNNDMEIVEEGWLDELVFQALRPGIGSAGAKLCFPDGSLQHAGAVVGLAGFAGHPLWRITDEAHFTPWGRADWCRNLLAVTAACVILRREHFTAIGGFDERFKVVGGDIDLGLRLHQRGLRNVYTPHARLLHHESASRREDQTPVGDLWTSFLSYRPYLRDGDPFYNPNLTRLRPDATLRGASEPDAQTLAIRALVSTLPAADR